MLWIIAGVVVLAVVAWYVWYAITWMRDLGPKGKWN